MPSPERAAAQKSTVSLHSISKPYTHTHDTQMCHVMPLSVQELRRYTRRIRSTRHDRKPHEATQADKHGAQSAAPPPPAHTFSRHDLLGSTAGLSRAWAGKQARNGRLWPAGAAELADWPRLAKAGRGWPQLAAARGSLRRALALEEASGEPAGRRRSRPRVRASWGPGCKPPCASGTYSTREAGASSLCVPYRGPGANVSA